MKLPGAERAFVDPIKVRDYLLSFDHPVGHSKARFFASLGFVRSKWPRLRRVLLEIGRDGDAVVGNPTPYGRKYEIRATIQGVGGRSAEVVTIWIILADESFPRFVTAYPGPLR